MPWRTEWVAPAIYLHHSGVTVYHSYKDNNIEQPLTFWYTTNPEYYEEFGGETDPFEFDVRDLNFPEGTAPQQVVDALTPPVHESEWIADTIRRAIDAGIISVPEPDDLA